MAKSKKRGPAQKSKSSYAQELQIKKQLSANIIADWTAQLCLDTMAIVLNDPEVMGHSALGSKRLMRVCEAFNELFDKTRLALSKSDEAEYWRVKIDQAQERIFGPGVAELLERVREHHSLRSAAASMEMAYSKAWRIVRAAEEGMGCKLLSSSTGGRHGGGQQRRGESFQ